MPLSVSTDMIKKLSDRERIFVDSFLEMIGSDQELRETACNFIAGKTNDIGLIADMKNLSSEGQAQACVEFIIIGLIAGNIKVKELSELVQKFSVHEPLIKKEKIFDEEDQ